MSTRCQGNTRKIDLTHKLKVNFMVSHKIYTCKNIYLSKKIDILVILSLLL